MQGAGIKNAFTLQDMRSPVNFLALGFGSGLAPVAPGTFGTLPALVLWIGLSQLPVSVYIIVIALMAVAGVWICQKASEESGHHDHGSIVWDEIVGYLVAVVAIPFSLTAMLIAFCLFRFFDIVKPWPVSWADKKLGGGFGIMFDDVLAGLMCCAILHLLHRFFPGFI